MTEPTKKQLVFYFMTEWIIHLIAAIIDSLYALFFLLLAFFFISPPTFLIFLPLQIIAKEDFNYFFEQIPDVAESCWKKAKIQFSRLTFSVFKRYVIERDFQ